MHKYKILIFVFIILIIVGSGIVVHRFFASKEAKEYGDIGRPLSEEENIEQEESLITDENMYKEISSHAYYGTVNYRDLIFVFKPLDYPLENATTKYECIVLEKDDTPYTDHSVYEVLLNKQYGLELFYISGPYESTFECTYKNNMININGTDLKSMPLEDIPDFVYEYGDYSKITGEEHGQF